MAEGDLELIRKAFALYEEGEFDAMFALAHPEVEFDPVFYPGTYRGLDAAREVFLAEGDPRRMWSVSEVELCEVDDRVLVTGRIETRTHFGGSMNLPIAWVFTVEAGKITRMDGYINRREALKAIGAENDDDRPPGRQDPAPDDPPTGGSAG